MRNKYRPLIGYRNTRKKCKTRAIREGIRRRKNGPHPPTLRIKDSKRKNQGGNFMEK